MNPSTIQIQASIVKENHSCAISNLLIIQLRLLTDELNDDQEKLNP
jgi:hypothetical protein